MVAQLDATRLVLVILVGLAFVDYEGTFETESLLVSASVIVGSIAHVLAGSL